MESNYRDGPTGHKKLIATEWLVMHQYNYNHVTDSASSVVIVKILMCYCDKLIKVITMLYRYLKWLSCIAKCLFLSHIHVAIDQLQILSVHTPVQMWSPYYDQTLLWCLAGDNTKKTRAKIDLAPA